MKKSFVLRLIGLSFLILNLSACAIFRSTHPPREKAMRPTETPMALADDLPLETLRLGIEQNIAQLEKRSDLVSLSFGSLSIDKADYIRALKALLQKVTSSAAKDEVLSYLKDNFNFNEIYGRKNWGEVFMTSYYDPVIEGAKERSERFTRPVYGVPKNMVLIQYDQFIEAFPKLAPKDKEFEQKSMGSVLRARIVSKEGEMARILPFYSRSEIDQESAPLLDDAEILAWVDPIESFFMQIQGSGKIRFAEGDEIRVGYAAQNGHGYEAIGKYLLDVIPKEEMSMQAIEKHLRSVSPEERDRILNLNPSYVFFQKLDSKSLTYFGTEVIPGRTIATDRRYFPKGALAYLEFEKPIFSDESPTSPPVEWRPTSRLVIDQDTGGAIRGPDRLDLYWDEGDKGLQAAGIMKNWGKLYYLTPKKHWINPPVQLSLGSN